MEKENDLGLGMHCLALKLNIIKSTNYLFTINSNSHLTMKKI